MAENKNLNTAKSAKEDEFYTQMEDIEKELQYYLGHFKDKVVFCNCDDPYESNFFKYFALKFNDLGLKKLICTCYNGSPIASKELTLFDEEPEDNKTTRVAHKVIINEVKDLTGNGITNLDDIKMLMKSDRNVVTRLEGNGDFRSEECIELLKQADIVVTNPPFSLFREYVAQLMEYDKKFLIIGNQNAFTYKEIFTLIQKNKLWCGVNSGDMSFHVPEYYKERETRFWIDETGQKWRSLGNITWFTNLDHFRRHAKIETYKRYNPTEFPKYDNYDAINVDKMIEIPCDYEGAMGVPITFLNKYNPEQFEILDARDYTTTDRLKNKAYALIKDADGTVNEKNKYARILIKRK